MANKSRQPPGSAGSAGPATDKDNAPDVDPTKNVLDLVEAAVRRLDDMRNVETIGVRELLGVEVKWVRREMKLRAKYTEKLAVAEAKRIDANRAGDASGVAVASERAVAQAAVLAGQVSSSAEALRALVTTTAATIAQQAEQANRQSEGRLAALEKVQYESAGRGAVANPQMEKFMERVDTLISLQATGGGKSEGLDKAWMILLGALGAVGGLVGMALGIYAVLKP